MKAIRITAIILLVIVSINALVAGYLFIIDPSGSKMKIPVSYLQHSPFSNFLVPGIVLFLVNGILSLVAAMATILKLKIYPALIVWQGILLLGWIVAQIILLQHFNFLHLLMGTIALSLFVLGNRLNI